MKKIFILIAIFVSGNVFSQGIEFEHGTFDEALEKAKKENKLIFMDCYTTWCGPCKWLAKNIFTQEKVGDYFNKNFVNVKMDMEKGEGIVLNKKYGVQAYPTLLFIDSNGNEVQKLLGGMKAEELITGAKTALDPSLRISALTEKYNNGNRDYDFLITYLKGLKREGDRDKMQNVSREIIAKTSLSEYMNKEQFYIISGANFAYNSKEYNYLLENKHKLKELLEPFEYGSIFTSPIYGYLNEFAKKCESLEALNTEVESCNKKFDLGDVEALKKSFQYTYYLANNQLQTWYDSKIKNAELLKGKEQYIYNYHGICDEILNSPKLSSSSEIVNDFTKKAISFAADKETGIIMGNLMLAKLYLHGNDKEKALNSFNIFFDENAKAGGVNDHPSVSKLKSAIQSL